MTRARRPRQRTRTRSRTAARRLAVQALYQWQLGGHAAHELVAQFLAGEEMNRADASFFEALVRGCLLEHVALRELIAPYLDRPVEQLDPVEYGVLLLATQELRSHPETPWRVVINEAVELALQFGAEQSHTYINGVLDKLGRQLRATEVAGS